ncbi:MAG TPA: energy transducer TonB [Candidatus Acidoferrales bacterium]
MSFQLKFGCLVAAVILGGASAAFAQSGGGANSGSGSNSGAGAGFVAGSNGNSGSSASSSSASSSNNSSTRKVRTKIAPDYPVLARQVNVTGKVKISATISAEGRVISTRVLGGSPLLTEAANTAVKQWRYEPAAKESVEIVEVEFSGK